MLTSLLKFMNNDYKKIDNNNDDDNDVLDISKYKSSNIDEKIDLLFKNKDKIDFQLFIKKHLAVFLVRSTNLTPDVKPIMDHVEFIIKNDLIDNKSFILYSNNHDTRCQKDFIGKMIYYCLNNDCSLFEKYADIFSIEPVKILELYELLDAKNIFTDDVITKIFNTFNIEKESFYTKYKYYHKLCATIIKI